MLLSRYVCGMYIKKIAIIAGGNYHLTDTKKTYLKV